MAFTGLELCGLIFVLFIFLWIVSGLWDLLYTCFLGRILGKTINVRKLGSWAVVTGSTDGIGKAYAEELARKGLNIVLISRSIFKLRNVAHDIELKFGVKTKIIDVDFTGGPEIYDRIGEEIRDLDVGVLINNVGMSYAYPEFLSYVPDSSAFCCRLINCNMLSVVGMTLLLLPKMAEKRKGLILNVSSASAVIPSPLLTMYSSSKAFVDKFSQDLALEAKHYGVTIQCVLPGFVATNMSRMRRLSFMVPSPKEYVQSQMNGLGLETSSAGFWFHKIQLIGFKYGLAVARPIVERLSWYGLFSTRTRAYRRKKRQEELLENSDKMQNGNEKVVY